MNSPSVKRMKMNQDKFNIIKQEKIISNLIRSKIHLQKNLKTINSNSSNSPHSKINPSFYRFYKLKPQKPLTINLNH